ncbi:PucR family transcriptional regulator [Pseudonocardia endophytica]|uniref:PucR-like helix-turn-helix protein n=1 Tax=Pseudonocardia endophytica TaxID=401976 RepID=A0A4R1HWW7_PSEEN|nr:helix-turn-helix domain-containing protein [Pseudonocardia endophytica]TCK26848.1 PucR-like helix-turn-helix protein [Pseudonocardia endophytica]
MTRTVRGREWLLDLAPDRDGVALEHAAGAPANTADAVERVGAPAVCWAVAIGEDMAAHIVREIPQFGGGNSPFEMLRKGTESSVVRALLLFAQPDAGLATITDESLEGIREFVRRGISLDGVLRGIRLGHAEMAHAFLRACEALVAPDRLADEMKAISDELFAFVDGFADAMTREYLAEYDRWTTSAAATRAETVRTILAGDDVDVAAASRVLGYDLRRRHVGLAMWTRSVSADAGLHLAATELLSARGATSTLVVPIGSGQLWAWGAIPASGPGPAPAPTGPDVRVAFGTPGAGVDGFRRTHREAQRAERLRRLSGDHRDGATEYDDVVVAALLASDVVAAGEFVRRELGDLATRGEQAADLRTTLLHYLDAERSLVTVAGELHVARGTVAYRVKRAEQILGRPAGERRLALHVALLLADELGDAVLGPA